MSGLHVTTVARIDRRWAGREILLGARDIVEVVDVVQLRVMGLTHLYTSEGFYSVPDTMTVTCDELGLMSGGDL